MAYFDGLDDQQLTPEAEAESRRRMLGMLASGGRPSVLGQPAPTNQPTPSPARLTPTEAPNLGTTPMFGNKPPALGTPPILPGRPNVMPTREDFPTKPVPTWQKVLGIAAAPFLPNLTTNILGRPQREAEQQYRGAVGDWERTQTDAARAATTAEANARTQSLLNPKPDKPENLDREAYDFYVGQGMSPAAARKQVLADAQEQKPDKTPSFDEATYQEWLKTNPNGTRLQFKKAMAAATEKPEREPKQLAVGPDGTVVELRPGVKVQPGTKPASKYGEPTPDEQRRADLAGNLQENLNTLEEIVNRRPDLFGPMAGRYTSLKAALGSGDPDIGTLETIKHQIGMAQISAHGMRSAQGIEGAAESILNSFKNQPKAVLASINAARNSVKTFTGDVERAKGGTTTKQNDPLGIRP